MNPKKLLLIFLLWQVSICMYSQTTDSSRIKKIRSASNQNFSFDSNKYLIKRPGIALPKFSLRTPLVIHGGSISYYYDYRSNIDTPFTDKNIAQHNIIGQMNVTAFNAIPLNVSFFIRRTNSSLFADINDVRVDFNAAQYGQTIKESYLKKLNAQLPDIKDSLLKKLKQFSESELSRIHKQFSRPDFQQRLVECNEILRVPAIAESIAGPTKADSVRKKAREFMDSYKGLKSKEALYHSKIDSLQNQITGAIAKTQGIRKKINSLSSPDEIIKELKKYGIRVPTVVQRLLSIRRFSLGRSQLNYSELTARNINLNGINFEYNSWYYFAFAAGMVDYRFRDFIVNRLDRKPQYVYLARLGIGRLENRYVILSAYKGQKQSYIQQYGNNNHSQSLEIYGLSLEAKYRLNNNHYVIAEVAESASPDLNLYGSSKSQKLFDWKDKTNKAYCVKAFSYLPKTQTRLEGMYRYTGAAYQSFDRFQVNSSQQAWHIKAEQYFWKRQLKLVVSLRSNEFDNPYIPQVYTNNMVFKSVQLTFRKKRWPVVSAGFMPSSQLTKIDGQLTENHFHTLNVVAYHQYKVGTQRVMTTITFNRFYNTASDTGFIYFNAVNFYMQHHLFFKRFTASLAASHSSNTGFELNVLEESLQFNILKKGNVAGGVKINNYNKTETKVGSWFRVGWRFMKTSWLQAEYDNGLIPGANRTLVWNQLMNLSINKTF